MERCLKEYAIPITILFFVISLISFHFLPSQPALVLIGGAVASIFVALKYRLDQAAYHKDLFDSRYECFLTVERTLDEWLKNLTTNEQMIENINSVMRRSYFLFGSKTYQFICRFCLAIVRENARRKKGKSEEITEDSCFLEKLFTDENLPDKFAELKVDSY